MPKSQSLTHIAYANQKFGSRAAERANKAKASVKSIKDPALLQALKDELKAAVGADAVNEKGQLKIGAAEYGKIIEQKNAATRNSKPPHTAINKPNNQAMGGGSTMGTLQNRKTGKWRNKTTQVSDGTKQQKIVTPLDEKGETVYMGMDDVLAKAKLRREGEATIEQVAMFMHILKTRHPERDWVSEKMDGKFKGFFLAKTRDTIKTNMNEFFRIVDPEVLEALPSFNDINRDFINDGEFNPISRDFSFRKAKGLKETHYHEPVHYLLLLGSRLKRIRMAKFFRQRIKGEEMIMLQCGKYGYKDHFPTTFEPKDDYAGRIYPHEKPGIPEGLEMVPRHLQKLALTPEDFLPYWNDQYSDGRYYWRETFLESLTLLFKSK